VFDVEATRTDLLRFRRSFLAINLSHAVPKPCVKWISLIFVRFSRPTARMHFSKIAVIAPFDGVPNVMIRVANLRHFGRARIPHDLTSKHYHCGRRRYATL
jgi:hypothetical protein